MESEITFPQEITSISGSYHPRAIDYYDSDDHNNIGSIGANISEKNQHSVENISLESLTAHYPGVVTLKGIASTISSFQQNFDNDLWGDEQDSNQLFEIPVSMVVILFLLYGAICVTALVGNSLVMGLSMCSGRMRTVTNLFIANLALADIIIGLFTIPFQFQAALLQRWDLPHFLCAFCPFVQVLSVNVSVLTLSAIALDRYRAVIHPLKAQASKRKAAWIILSIWIVGFLLALPTEFDYEVTFITSDRGESKPFCTNVWLSPHTRMYYNQAIVVIQYFLPLCIISCAYIRMGSKLWKNQSPGNKEQSRDALLLRNKKKVVKMLSLVIILFAICWFPLQTYNFIQYIFPAVNTFYYINVLWFTFHLLAMSNSCCNPFVYAIYNEKFHQEFREKLACFSQKCCWRKNRNTSQSLEDNESLNNTSTRGRFDTEWTGSTDRKIADRVEVDSEIIHISSSSTSKCAQSVVSITDVSGLNAGGGLSVQNTVMGERQFDGCIVWKHNRKSGWNFSLSQMKLKKCQTGAMEEEFV